MRFRGNGALQEAVEAIKNGATEIDLNFNNIGHEGASALANELVNNKSLQTLDLWENKIGREGASALANALANNESLQALGLGRNNIGAEGATALANALANNESLQTLRLKHNYIGHEGATALANALFMNESMHTLDLDSNNIGVEGASALANALANNESLHTLNLCSNEIGDEGATALANALVYNESLQTLDLGWSNIGDKGATTLANALANNESLHTLKLGGNNIGDKGAAALANALANNESLQRLDLNSNNIGDEGAAALANALANNESLQTLILNSNKIGDEGARALANALANNESLQELYLCSNEIGDEGATALANALVYNESLQTLELGGNNIGDEGASALASALANNESLRTLDLGHNKIAREGAKALGNALANNEPLRTLDLDCNNIGDEGARALANALANNESLHTLSLGFNNIGDEGAAALANALANNESLHTLSLGFNNIGDEGTAALANALANNESLHTLSLSGNDIGDEGATALANALANIKSLHTLSLRYSQIGDEGASALANALANNESLHTLDLRENDIGDEGARALANALAENKTLQKLDINFNRRHSAALKAALKAALERNRTLYEQSQTLLMQACKNGDILEAEKLVVGGTRIDARDTLGQTALFYVCRAKDENSALLLAKLLFKYSADRSSESLRIRKAIANALSKDYMKLSTFLSYIHSLPLAQLQTNALREMVVMLYEQGVQTLKEIRSLTSAQLEKVGIASLQDRRALLQVFLGPEQVSKLKSLAAELSNARAKRSEEKADLPHPMLRDFFAEQLSRENTIAAVADFDLQQADVSEKEKALNKLQKSIHIYREKIPERNQMRRDLVASIRETLAKSSEIKLQELEDDANDVTDTCRKLWRDTLGEPADIDVAAELVASGQVQKAIRSMMEAIKAWEARHDTIAARERTIAALNALEESTKRLGIQPTFFKTLTYPERSQELVLELQDVYQAFVAEFNVLSKGDPMADAPLNKLRHALACIFSLYTCTIPSMVSRVKDLEHSLSRLTSGLTEPDTEDAELLLKSLRNKTRKRKRLASELDDAREDARAGDEESQARIADLEQELAQIGNVDKFDSELLKKRARLLRHAEEHYPELLWDQNWLKRLGLGDDGSPLELSKLGLWRTTARRVRFVTLKELASKPGKSVQKVRGPDGRDFVLKAFHLVSEAWSSRFYHQVAALAQLQSAYIVQIQSAFMQNACKGCILMPFYSGGDLATWIRDHSHADLAMRLRIANGLLSGLHDLHSRGFVHCNVKPENVFLAKGLSPVLGDFDDVQTHNVPMTQPMQATIKYMAPELRNGDVDKVEPAVDMFSVGVVLAELFDGSEVSDAAQALVSSLQSADPTQRPTALEALRHEAFQVELVKEASCAICLDIYPVGKGVSCADGHFTCRECLSKSVRAAAQPQAHGNVRRDGSMCCVAPDCKLLVSGRAIASAVPDEDFSALLDIVRAHFERDAAAEQERQLRDRVDAALRELGLDRTTQNHIRVIHDEVLAMSCPRCSTVFADFDGCCALKCSACSCLFCAWCLQDTGNDSDACHQHVATCPSKPTGDEDPFFSDFAVVKQAWTRLRAQRLRRYMAEKIEDAGIRALVQQRLRPLLTPDIVGDDFSFEE